MTTALQEAVAALVAKKKHEKWRRRVEHLNAEIDRSIMSRALVADQVILLRSYAHMMLVYREITGEPWVQDAKPFFRPPAAHPLDDLTVESRLDHYAQRNTRPISWSPARAIEWAMFQSSGVKLERGEAEKILESIKAARAAAAAQG